MRARHNSPARRRPPLTADSPRGTGTVHAPRRQAQRRSAAAVPVDQSGPCGSSCRNRRAGTHVPAARADGGQRRFRTVDTRGVLGACAFCPPYALRGLISASSPHALTRAATAPGRFAQISGRRRSARSARRERARRNTSRAGLARTDGACAPGGPVLSYFFAFFFFDFLKPTLPALGSYGRWASCICFVVLALLSRPSRSPPSSRPRGPAATGRRDRLRRRASCESSSS